MKLLSIHVGKIQTFVGNGKEQQSAINKKSVLSAKVETLGLVDDEVFDKKHHGGPDQAVYAYAQSDYDWWKSEFSLKTHSGSFGENLVIDAFDTNDVYIGDRFTIGDVILEVSAPRIPCSTLSDSFNRKSLLKEFREAVRPGIYFRVIENGEIFPNSEIGYSRGAYDISVNEFFHFYYAQKTTAEIQRYLDAPIDIRSRTAFEKKI